MKHKIIPAVRDVKRFVLAIGLTRRDGEKRVLLRREALQKRTKHRKECGAAFLAESKALG